MIATEKSVAHGSQGREVHTRPHGEASGGEGGADSSTWARAFLMVSVGRNRQGRVSRFRTA